ncbi:Uncharacterised protein [Mycobacteroides abscessus subsp. abscessus]|nr:Uncharacterised protein [Mycobacteroides abscessus subsp. abscessus]
MIFFSVSAGSVYPSIGTRSLMPEISSPIPPRLTLVSRPSALR